MFPWKKIIHFAKLHCKRQVAESARYLIGRASVSKLKFACLRFKEKPTPQKTPLEKHLRGFLKNKANLNLQDCKANFIYFHIYVLSQEHVSISSAKSPQEIGHQKLVLKVSAWKNRSPKRKLLHFQFKQKLCFKVTNHQKHSENGNLRIFFQKKTSENSILEKVQLFAAKQSPKAAKKKSLRASRWISWHFS